MVDGCFATESVDIDQVAPVLHNMDAPVFSSIFSPQQMGILDILLLKGTSSLWLSTPLHTLSHSKVHTSDFSL